MPVIESPIERLTTAELNDKSIFNSMAEGLKKGMASLHEDQPAGEVQQNSTVEVKADKPSDTKGAVLEGGKDGKGTVDVSTTKAETGVREGSGEKQAESELETPVGLSVKASEKFNLIKSSRDDWRKKAETAENTLKTLQGDLEKAKTTQNPAIQQEIEALKKQNAELENIVKIKAVEEHPKFKQYFDTKTSNAIELIKIAAGSEHATRAEQIAKMQDGNAKEEAIESFLVELPQSRQIKVGNALAELDKIQLEKHSEIAKARENYSRLEQEQTATTQKQQDDWKAKVNVGVQMAEAAAAEMEAFKTIEGNDTHNKEVEGRKGFIRAFFEGKIDEKMIPMIPVMVGDYFDVKNRIIPSKDAHIAKLEQQLKDLQSSSPRANGGGNGATKQGNDGPAPGSGFVKEWAKSLQGR